MNQLRVHYRVMTSINEKVRLEGKTIYKMKSIIYMDTPSGKIEENEWINRVKDLVKENKEDTLFNKLKKYSLNELAWIKEEEKAEQYALKLYAMRIWECEDWMDKDLFNQFYLEDKVQLSLF